MIALKKKKSVKHKFVFKRRDHSVSDSKKQNKTKTNKKQTNKQKTVIWNLKKKVDAKTIPFNPMATIF